MAVMLLKELGILLQPSSLVHLPVWSLREERHGSSIPRTRLIHHCFLEHDLDPLKQQVVGKVLSRCKRRVKEQVVQLNNRIQFVYGLDSDHYIHPEIIAGSSGDESTQDVELLGHYCDETHGSYMRLCEDRMRQLKKLAAEVIHPSTTGELEALKNLGQLAYSVRRSSSFKHFVQANLNRKWERGISLPTTSKIIERIEKISKFYRAALAMTDFVTKVKKLGRKITIEPVPTSRIQVPELANRKAAQLCARAGRQFRWDDEDKVRAHARTLATLSATCRATADCVLRGKSSHPSL